MVNAHLCLHLRTDPDTWHLSDVLENRLAEQQSARSPLGHAGSITPSSAPSGASVAKQSPVQVSEAELDAENSPGDENSRAPSSSVSNSATDPLDPRTGISDLMRADL